MQKRRCKVDLRDLLPNLTRVYSESRKRVLFLFRNNAISALSQALLVLKQSKFMHDFLRRAPF